MLNKQKGNMYGFVTHTWNPIRGKCPHDCKYCYMKSFWEIQKSEKQVLDEKCLQDNLGSENFIFVGSSTDMFAESVPDNWIEEVFKCCKNREFKNKYLFQTKNPKKMMQGKFIDTIPSFSYLGITLETNRDTDKISSTMNPVERFQWFATEIPAYLAKFVTIEPIMDFDIEPLVQWIKVIKPRFVAIGADSKGHNLPEPSPKKLKALIEELKKFTEVKIKPNLNRLLNTQKRGRKS